MKFEKNVSFSFALLIALLLVTPEVHSGIMGAIRSLLQVFAYIIIPSVGCTLVYQQFRKTHFTTAEFLALSAANALLLMPTIVLISISILPYQFVSAPLIIFSLASCFLLYESEMRALHLRKNMYTLLCSIILLGICIWILTHAYYPLPDFDPYYWLNKYQAVLGAYRNGSFSLSDRPGFFAVFLLYNAIANIDAYALFKYVFPMFFVLPLFPLWMIAKKMKYSWIAYAIMSAMVWSASTMLYAITSMPQMICISAFFFFVSFITYARITQEKFYIGVAGAILALSIPMYEIALVPCIPIILCLVWKWRKEMKGYLIKNPVVALLLALLFLTNVHHASMQITFFAFWVYKIAIQFFAPTPNLLFPAHYINVDGNSVGWQGVWGVIQYYSYYVGPPILLLLFSIIAIAANRKGRHLIIQEIKKYPEAQIIGITFFIFFTISEIFPRILNLALLPERTWIFGGILFIYPAVLIMNASTKKNSIRISGIILLASLLSISAAWYINNQKKNFIPTYQLTAASWVRSNLSIHRTIVSDENSNLLGFFSYSKTATVFPLYCNEKFSDPKTLFDAIKTNNSGIQSIENLYIFYAQTDPGNPYRMRPYIKLRESCGTFVFDKYPHSYERVYSDANRVIIWKVR